MGAQNELKDTLSRYTRNEIVQACKAQWKENRQTINRKTKNVYKSIDITISDKYYIKMINGKITINLD
jgi:hypothetical protein